jgi:hypothetical protein
MYAKSQPSSLWVSWLLAVSAGVAFFGVVLVVAPGVARQGFSLLAFGDPERIASFGPDAIAYISLAHAVLGSVMFGWGVALLLVVRRLLARGLRLGWQIVAVSVCAWFVPDTSYCLWSGFWPNAVLNLVFIFLFVLPLVATRGQCRQ